MNREPAPSDRLLSLLDEWQPEPEVSGHFNQALRRRIQAAEATHQAHPWRAWWQIFHPSFPRAAAAFTMVLFITVGAFLYSGGRDAVPTPEPIQALQTAQMDPVVRDLQTLDRDGELLDHLDFLSTPMVATPPRLQDQD